MPETPTRRHCRIKVALVVAGWLVALLVLVALAPESLKVAVAMLFGAPSFAFILRNYLNWPPKEPFKTGPLPKRWRERP